MKPAGPTAGPEPRSKGNRHHAVPPVVKEVGGVGRDEVASGEQREEAADVRLTQGRLREPALAAEILGPFNNLTHRELLPAGPKDTTSRRGSGYMTVDTAVYPPRSCLSCDDPLCSGR